MRCPLFVSSLFLLLSATTTAFALDFSREQLPYSDIAREENVYALPVSVLTAEGVVEGYPDGTFGPQRLLNRAEFLKIVLRSAPALREGVEEAEPQRCFPDVKKQDWFSQDVCFARERGIVEGYPDGFFHPERNVNYAEAAKILAETYDYALTREAGDAWYAPYVRAAEAHGTALADDFPPGTPITRGEMAVLAAQFLAESKGELAAYRAAERGGVGEVGEEGTTTTSASSSSSVSSASSPKLQPNQTFIPTSPLPNLSARNHLLMLGEKAPVIATVQVTPNDEPVHVRTVTITLVAEASSVSTIEVFDDLGFVLGIAALDLTASAARDVYTLSLSPAQAYFIERKDTIILAARPLLREEDAGGTSGQTVHVESMTVSATGLWSNQTNTVSTSGSDFQEHETANAVLDAIENAGKTLGTFTTGTQRTIGTFSFAARQNADADPALSSLTFSVSAPAEVTVSNAVLRGNDASTEHPCTVAGSTITCSAIPEAIGSLQSLRTLTLAADVAVTSHPDPFLQVTLQNSGTPSSAGDITWTDGSATFTWVPLDPPVADGTAWQ